MTDESTPAGKRSHVIRLRYSTDELVALRKRVADSGDQRLAVYIRKASLGQPISERSPAMQKCLGDLGRLGGLLAYAVKALGGEGRSAAVAEINHLRIEVRELVERLGEIVR